MLYAATKVLAFLIVNVWFAFRLRVEGRENIPKEGGFILACKHQSAWDPILVAVSIPRRMGFLGKIEIARVPLLGKFTQALGMIPVDRSKSAIRSISKAISQVAEAVDDGKPMMVFVEGTRVRANRVDEVQGGVAMMVQSVKQPAVVVPCAIYWEKGGSLLSKVSISYGEPIKFYCDGMGGTNKDKRYVVTETLREKINFLLFSAKKLHKKRRR